MNKAVLVAALLSSSCAPPPPAVLYGSQRVISAADYRDVLATWTRSDKVYLGFETKMFGTATFHSPEFRRAFAIAFPEIYGHGGNITRRELVDLTGDVEQFHNFFLCLYTADTKWNDLAQEDSIWRLTLIGSDEVAVDPAEIILVKIDANLNAVYPFISRFDKCYVVRFPLTDAMHRLVLDPASTSATVRVASALGAAELHWQLVPAHSPAAPTEAPPAN